MPGMRTPFRRQKRIITESVFSTCANKAAPPARLDLPLLTFKYSQNKDRRSNNIKQQLYVGGKVPVEQVLNSLIHIVAIACYSWMERTFYEVFSFL